MRELVDHPTVRFGRSRFLAALGAVVFDLAVRRAAPAEATHTSSYPCDGPACHCCGTSNCTPVSGACYQYGGNGHCWYICWRASNGNTQYYKCCDFQSAVGNICTCRKLLGAC